MAHSLVRRCRSSRHVGNHWFGISLLDVLRSLFLGITADLTHEHNGLGLRILPEHLKHVHKAQPHNRVPTQPHCGGLSQARPAEAVGDLVCEGTAPGYQADITV